jgi:hypothetical protein
VRFWQESGSGGLKNEFLEYSERGINFKILKGGKKKNGIL